MYKVILIPLLLLATSCASNSGIVPLGNNTFIIAKQAATGFSGTGAIKTEALQEASAECRKSSQAVEIQHMEESQPPYLLGNYPKIELTFKCIVESPN